MSVRASGGTIGRARGRERGGRDRDTAFRMGTNVRQPAGASKVRCEGEGANRIILIASNAGTKRSEHKSRRVILRVYMYMYHYGIPS